MSWGIPDKAFYANSCSCGLVTYNSLDNCASLFEWPLTNSFSWLVAALRSRLSLISLDCIWLRRFPSWSLSNLFSFSNNSVFSAHKSLRLLCCSTSISYWAISSSRASCVSKFTDMGWVGFSGAVVCKWLSSSLKLCLHSARICFKVSSSLLKCANYSKSRTSSYCFVATSWLEVSFSCLLSKFVCFRRCAFSWRKSSSDWRYLASKVSSSCSTSTFSVLSLLTCFLSCRLLYVRSYSSWIICFLRADSAFSNYSYKSWRSFANLCYRVLIRPCCCWSRAADTSWSICTSYRNDRNPSHILLRPRSEPWFTAMSSQTSAILSTNGFFCLTMAAISKPLLLLLALKGLSVI